MSRKIIVTGFPRSGTGYMAEFLKVMGLDVGHEVKKEDGWVDWHEMPDIGFHSSNTDNLVRVIIRNPIDIMGSAFTLMNSSWHYMDDYVKVNHNKGKEKTQWIAEFLIQWYSICLEQHSHLIIATESVKYGSKFYNDVVSFFDLKNIDDFSVSNKMNTRSNRSVYRKFIIEELEEKLDPDTFDDFNDLVELHKNLLDGVE